MKILIWDIETLPLALFQWSLHQDHNEHQNIIRESSIVCVSWMYAGMGKKPQSISILDDPGSYKKSVYTDRVIVDRMRDVIEESDILVAQNGDNFDLKILNWRSEQNGLKPLAIRQQVDTLKESRKVFRPPSHRLDYKGKALGYGGKDKVDGQLWRDIALREFGGSDAVCRTAIKKMLKYNRRDVTLLEEVYLRERAWYKKHPNRILYDPIAKACPVCGGKQIMKHGIRHLLSRSYQNYKCSSCGKQFRSTQSLPVKADFK